MLISGFLALAAPAWALDPLDPLAPTASISASPNPAITDQLVSFDGSGSSDIDDGIVRYEWDLDGNTSYETDTAGEASASATYLAPGTLTVRLRVTDLSGKTGEAEATLVVKDPPRADFNFSPSTPLTNQQIDFTSTSADADGSIASYAWDFDGDNTTDSTSDAASHSYARSNTYQVRLTVTDNDGLSDVVTKNVTVLNQRPSASFDFAPALPQSHETITFTSTSSDPDGSIQSELWDLDDDGDFDDASGHEVTRAFETWGSKTVSLKVIDDDAGEATASRTVVVANQPPTADFDVNPAEPQSLSPATFTATATDSDGAVVAYAWDFDSNGTTDASGSQVTHPFAGPGQKTVTLRVIDDGGESTSVTKEVNVLNQQPTVDFTYSPTVFDSGVNVTFTSSAADPDGSIVAYRWDFDDDGVFEKSGRIAVHQFATAGTHVVGHQVVDDSGAASVVVQQRVTTGNRPPTAGFSQTPSSPRTLENVTFTSTSSDPDGGIASQNWDLDGDGDYGEPEDAVGQTAVRQFPRAGTYTIGLQVLDVDGATNVFTRPVTVANREPTASLTISPAAPKTLEEVTFTSTSTDPEGPIGTHAWDLDNDGSYDDAFDATAKHSFATSGSFTVKLRVVDADGAEVATTRTFTVANRPPAATFTQSPPFPRAFETVTFTSTAGDVDGTVASQAWDTDNDGSFDDGTGPRVTRRFTESKSHTVRLRVVDNKGAETIGVQTVIVGNRAPTASFSFLPVEPREGEVVSFFSTASDPDSPIASQRWDLNGDGSFDDAQGASAARAFAAGSYTVSLLVTDSEGESSSFSATFRVLPPAPAAVSAVASGPRLLSPFPIVRITGTIRGSRTRLRRLTVAAPPGSTVVIRCRGRSCPFGRQSRVIKSAARAKGTRPATQAVLRVRRFERRSLRAGTLIRVFVTKPGTIGKYTRFQTRNRKPPSRTDRCLMPGSRKAIDCPPS